jgi:hypothetical protein
VSFIPLSYLINITFIKFMRCGIFAVDSVHDLIFRNVKTCPLVNGYINCDDVSFGKWLHKL